MSDESDGGAQVAEPTEADELAEALAEPEPIEGDDDDSAELEIGADKIRVPKAVKGAWDGLHKSVQAAKEEAKADKAAALADRQRANEFAQTVATVAKEVGKLQAIDDQLEPYLKLTAGEWAAWGSQEPERANQANLQIAALQRQRAELAGQIDFKVRDAQTKHTQATTEAQAAAERDIAATVKDWSPAKRATLEAAAVEYKGITKEVLAAAAHIPGVWQMIEDAATLRAARAKIAASKGKGAAPAVETQPQPRLQSRGGGARDPFGDKASTDDFARAFLKKRAGG